MTEDRTGNREDRRLVALISTEGKTTEQIAREAMAAQRRYQRATADAKREVARETGLDAPPEPEPGE